MGIRSHVAASTATLALALFFISPATAQPVALTKTQSAALDAYNDAVSSFKSILSQRRAQINSSQALPNLPGQALYLARNKMMGARKDLKDVVDLGTAIARAKGLDASNADAAGRIGLGLFFAETNGNQNIGNARSNT